MDAVNINFKKLKTAYGLTQYQIAGKLDAKKGNIGAYVEGRAVVPNILVKKVFEVFGLPKEKFFDFLFDPELEIIISKEISL